VSYSAYVRKDRHREQILRAFRRGETSHSKTNTKITFHGELHEVATFEGIHRFALGRMSFFHWDAEVMCVDFTQDMVTDFGYDGFSLTTGRNIRNWMWELKLLSFMEMKSLEQHVAPLDYTLCGKHHHNTLASDHKERSPTQERWRKFYMNAPWVKQVDGHPWFHGPSYSEAQVWSAMQVMRGFSPLDWHWFTADWIDGRWVKHFIDADAEKRFHRREARRNVETPT
jgi:hypothetical protein